MEVFLTGATGYIGNKLALRLANTGHTVHALVRDPGNAVNCQHPSIKLFKGDLLDRASIAAALHGCEWAYHVAGYARLWAKDKNLFYDVHVKGTSNILEESYRQGIRKLVYTSSTAVFGNSLSQPMTEKDPRITGFDNDYDLSKFIAERLISEYSGKGLYGVIVNPSRVYGPGTNTHSNAITRVLRQFMQNHFSLVPGCGEVTSNYAFIDDVVDGHLLAMQKGIAGERYILGGENISYNYLYSLVKELTGKNGFIRLPVPAMKIAAYMQVLKQHLFKIDPAFTPAIIDKYFKNAAFSSQKAIHQLGYHITPFREGLLKTIEHLKTLQHVK